MFFEYACHLLVREGVDWLILAVVLAWRMISLQLRDSAGLSKEDHRLRLYAHPSGGWAPDHLLLFGCIVQIKAAAVKGRVCGVQKILCTLGMLRDPPFGRQNDNKSWRCHAERSEASRLGKHDTLAGILPLPENCHAEHSEASRLGKHDTLAEILPLPENCHAEHSEASRLGKHDTLAGILIPSGVLRDPPFGRQNDNNKWRCHAEHSEASRLGKHDTLAGILIPSGVPRDSRLWLSE